MVTDLVHLSLFIMFICHSLLQAMQEENQQLKEKVENLSRMIEAQQNKIDSQERMMRSLQVCCRDCLPK